MDCLAVLHRHQENAASNHLIELALDRQAADGGDGIHQSLVAVNLQLAFILSFFHGSSHHAHHPHNTHDVVRVLMGDENVVDMAQVHIHILQDAQDAVSSSCIHHEIFIPVLYGKTGIITAGGLGVSCSKYV